MRSTSNAGRLFFLAKQSWSWRKRARGLFWCLAIGSGALAAEPGDGGRLRPGEVYVVTNAGAINARGGTVVLERPLLKHAVRVEGGTFGKTTSIAIDRGGRLSLKDVDVVVPIEVLPGGWLEIAGASVVFKAPACLLVRPGARVELRCPLEVPTPVENSGTMLLNGGAVRCPNPPEGGWLNEAGGSVISNRGSAANFVRLTGAPGRRYVVQASPAFSPADWTDISGALAADAAGTISFIDTNPPATRFYRLRHVEP